MWIFAFFIYLYPSFIMTFDARFFNYTCVRFWFNAIFCFFIFLFLCQIMMFNVMFCFLFICISCRLWCYMRGFFSFNCICGRILCLIWGFFIYLYLRKIATIDLVFCFYLPVCVSLGDYNVWYYVFVFINLYLWHI